MEFYLRQPVPHFLTSWHPRRWCACQIGWTGVPSHPWQRPGNSERLEQRTLPRRCFPASSRPAWNCPAPLPRAPPAASFPSSIERGWGGVGGGGAGTELRAWTLCGEGNEQAKKRHAFRTWEDLNLSFGSDLRAPWLWARNEAT